MKPHCLTYSVRIFRRFISYYPLKQGLKLYGGQLPTGIHLIYILLSIKTRIETTIRNYRIVALVCIYILLSIKTRIETGCAPSRKHLRHPIYILLSIKTRIETDREEKMTNKAVLFISYYPLKQGLKLFYNIDFAYVSYDLYPTIH